MKKMSGIAIVLPKSRKAIFEENANHNLNFSEPIPDFSHSNSTPLLCFIVNSHALTHISLGHSGQSAGTKLRKINLYSVIKLNKPLTFTIFKQNINKNVANNIELKFLQGGFFTENGLNKIVDVLIKEAPETRQLLFRYDKDFTRLFKKLSQNEILNLAMQKEAILTAFLVAGQDFDRESVIKWAPTEKPNSFLDGLDESLISERQAIMNDFMKMPGYDAMESNIKGIAEFHSNTDTLTIIYADQEPLEQLTGADLIYYNDKYKSFIFVQYKIMENGVYRPTDQLYKQINDINNLLYYSKTQTINTTNKKNHKDFRLHSNPFFIKLCPKIQFIAESTALTKGMYIPLEYWQALESSGNFNGKLGGKIATVENVDRYLTNTDFATLVTKAWIGSDPTHSSILSHLIKETLTGRKAALYAIKREIEVSSRNKCK